MAVTSVEVNFTFLVSFIVKVAKRLNYLSSKSALDYWTFKKAWDALRREV